MLQKSQEIYNGGAAMGCYDRLETHLLSRRVEVR